MDKKQEATIIEQEDNIEIKRIVDTETKMTYMLLKGTLDNGFVAYIRLPMSSIFIFNSMYCYYSWWNCNNIYIKTI